MEFLLSCNYPIDAAHPISPIDSGLVALTSDTIRTGQFITWVEQTPLAQKSNVLAAISAGNNSTNISALNSHLDVTSFPITDISDEFMLLAIVGQLRALQSITPLKNLIWLATPVMTCADGDAGDAGAIDGGDISALDCDGIVRARAAEMLAYIEIAQPRFSSLSDVLTIASTHPSVTVRRAAMDAYLFNNGDSADAAATLRSLVQDADVIFVDGNRFTSTMDAAAFDDQLNNFYSIHSDQLPPTPNSGGTDAGVTSSTCP